MNTNDPKVELLDYTASASQVSDEPLQVKVTVTSVYMVEGTTADQAVVEVTR